MNTEVLNLNSICQSFPEKPIPEVFRDNVQSTVDTIFQGDIRVIFIDGPPGIGKTTFISQFARKYPDRAICLFVKPSTRWGFDPNFLKIDLCCQMFWAVRQKELKDYAVVIDSLLGTLFLQIAKLSRYNHKPFYFAVDGLDDIPAEHAKTKDLILDLLPPPGMQGFRFIFAGDDYSFPKTFQNIPHKSLPLTPFSLGETGL